MEISLTLILDWTVYKNTIKKSMLLTVLVMYSNQAMNLGIHETIMEQ